MMTQSGTLDSAAEDFFRSGSVAGELPDGSTDVQDGIFRTGQTTLDTGVNGDSGLTLDDLRSRNSTQLTSGDTGVTDTNMTAVGVDLLGKVRLSNQLSIPDLRATNPNPQDYAAGFSNVFKQSSSIGMTGLNGIPTHVNLTTTRQYAQGTDFSGGQVRQDVDLPDGRQYFRMGTSGTTWGAWTLENQNRNLQDRFLSQAATMISLANQIRWVGSYHIMTKGVHAVEPSGYFRIDMPADGFLVPVAGGGTRAVVAAVAGSSVDTGGIPLNSWESLYYKHVKGTGAGSVPANFLIVPYTVNTSALSIVTESEDWIRIATRDGLEVWTLGNGDTTTSGGQIGRGADVTIANWTAMKQRAMGGGYFFSPGGNTAVPLAFGFTGTCRWINGGSTPIVNTTGYKDATQAGKVAGTAIRGVNGAANRTWRLMTAAEKPAWFGGAQRGVDPILAASTTVVDLNDNEVLYYVPSLASGSADGQWVVGGYSGQVTTPVHWLPVASKQTTRGNATIQVLIGGVQMALRAGDAQYMSIGGEHTADAKHRKVTHKGLKYARWTHAGIFSGLAANGQPAGGSADGVYVSWAANTMIYGISDGYASWGNQYSYINVPPAGTQIPLTVVGSNVTRTVATISGRTYIPLAPWEALYFIPPAYTVGYSSNAGDFVIGFYNGNHHIPRNAVLIAKYEASGSQVASTTINKIRIQFADGTYIQPGIGRPTSAATAVQNDHAQGSGDWRPLVYPGQTGAGMTAPMPAVAGVVGAYGAPYTAFFNYRTLDDDPRGNIHLEGIIQLNGFVAAGARLAFMPGVQVRGFPIVPVMMTATTLADAHPIMGQLRFQNATVNGSQGIEILAWGGSFTAANPLFTLGANGAAQAAGTPSLVSLSNITLPHA